MLARLPFEEREVDIAVTLPCDLKTAGQGRNRFTYYLGDTPYVLKLSSRSHGFENQVCAELGGLAARVRWEGDVTVRWANSLERGGDVMFGLLQSKCLLAKHWLSKQNPKERSEFFHYVLIAVLYAAGKGYGVSDLDISNLAIDFKDGASKTPKVKFIDCQDWEPNTKSFLKDLKTLLRDYAPEVLSVAVHWLGAKTKKPARGSGWFRVS